MIRRKQEWTSDEYRCVLGSIKRWLNSRFFCTKDGILFGVRTNKEMERLLGLPYTSSGRAACVGVTNTLLYLDYDMQYHVYSFEMDEDGVIVAVCHDNEENELLIPINK